MANAIIALEPTDLFAASVDLRKDYSLADTESAVGFAWDLFKKTHESFVNVPMKLSFHGASLASQEIDLVRAIVAPVYRKGLETFQFVNDEFPRVKRYLQLEGDIKPGHVWEGLQQNIGVVINNSRKRLARFRDIYSTGLDSLLNESSVELHREYQHDVYLLGKSRDVLGEAVGLICAINNEKTDSFSSVARRSESVLPSRFESVSTLAEIRLGEKAYPLRNVAEARCIRHLDGHFEFSLKDEDDFIVGCGNSEDEASRDFAAKLHCEFQRLHRKRPFQRSQSEKRMWSQLTALIDLEAYEQARTRVYPETGFVKSLGAAGQIVVTWLSERTETIFIGSAPDEIAMFCEGQWFDADVERRNDDERTIVRLLTVRSRSAVTAMEGSELAKTWDAIGGIGSLPDSKVDWTNE